MVNSQFRNDKQYRDFFWQTLGENLKPDNPTPVEQAEYEAREKLRLGGNLKQAGVGMIPAVLAGIAGRISAAARPASDVSQVKAIHSEPEKAASEKKNQQGAADSIPDYGGQAKGYGDAKYVGPDGKDVPTGLPSILGGNTPPINRAQEVAELFSSTSARSGIQIGNRSLLEVPNNGNAKIFSGATDSEVQNYFLELTGASQLPTARVIQGKGAIYVVSSPQGNFTLRDFSTSSGQTGSAWTIDLPKGVAGTTYNPEIKFLRGSNP
jgi:hypothetical protein